MIFNIVLKNRKILIVGGGKIAERKIKTFLSEDVTIHVISPDATEFIKELSIGGKIKFMQKKVEEQDISNEYFMVLCATDDQKVNDMISGICESRNILHINTGNRENSDIMMVANVNIGDVTISMSTGGKSPGTSKILKELLLRDMASSDCIFEDTIKSIYHKKI